jgi:hypothetical protein
MNRIKETSRIAASLLNVADEYNLRQGLNRIVELETDVLPILDAYD